MGYNSTEDKDDIQKFRIELCSSLLSFIMYFYELRNNRPFKIPVAISRPSHYVLICNELELVFDLKTKRLLINIPPGHGKSTLLTYFIAWCLAQYPDCHFLYISVSYELAETHVSEIKAVMSLVEYQKIFCVRIDPKNASRGDFKTTMGGRVAAKGAMGTIVGLNAGLPYLDRFSGCAVIDDAHNPDDVHSDTMRESVIDNYKETILQRVRGPNVPIISIGQRLHEQDLSQFMIDGEDGSTWKTVILAALDDHDNALCPEIKSVDELLTKKKVDRYTFYAQFQQTPRPAGGALFQENDFIALAEEPVIIETFITADTAETDKNWNDPTVFSFWGLYKINVRGVDTDTYALHWLACEHDWIDVADLEDRLLDFYAMCMRHKIKPGFIAIEKKSSGTSLLGSVNKIQGLKAIGIERTKASGNKTARYLEMAPFIGQKLVTLPQYAKHTSMCIEHMLKISPKGTHAHDDICDTCYDAVKLKLIDKIINNRKPANSEAVASVMQASQYQQMAQLRRNNY